MKKLFLYLIYVFYSSIAFSQTDTIFTNNQKISCVVKEITPDAVRFSYVGEDLVNSIYKNTVQKIVFKSGRVQTFAENTSYKTVNGAEDYDNVAITEIQSEVNGLYKLGDVSSQATENWIALTNADEIKKRAIKCAKIKAAMLGANIIYLTQMETNNTSSDYNNFTQSNIAAVAYSNTIPNYDDFLKLIGTKTQFQIDKRTRFGSNYLEIHKVDYTKKIVFNKVYNENGLIMVDANIEDNEVKNNIFRVVYFTSNEFTLFYEDESGRSIDLQIKL